MDFLKEPIIVAAILCFCVFGCEWLAEKTWLRKLGGSLLVILAGAFLANTGILPSASNASPIYIHIFTYLAPLAIFYLLLDVNLRSLRKAGGPMIIMFLIGALGTVLGVFAGMMVVGGPSAFGELSHALAGMFTGTYIGGSINFNAVALHYEVQNQVSLYAGATAVDNIITTLWMVVGLMLPPVLQRMLPRAQKTNGPAEVLHLEEETETTNPMGMGFLIGLGLVCLWVSEEVSEYFASLNMTVPSILVLTTLGLVFAQMPFIQRIHGAKLLGMFSVYLLLAVIGAFCEIGALAEIGSLGLRILIFATVLIIVHGLVVFGAAFFLRYDWVLASVASQTNVGGPTTALALARSLGRPDLVVPCILVGSLGNGLGTYLGFFVAGLLS